MRPQTMGGIIRIMMLIRIIIVMIIRIVLLIIRIIMVIPYRNGLGFRV